MTDERYLLDIKDWVIIHQVKDEDCPKMTSRISSGAIAKSMAEGYARNGHRVFYVGSVEAMLRLFGATGIPEMEGR
jgi:hypothetical protein